MPSVARSELSRPHPARIVVHHESRNDRHRRDLAQARARSTTISATELDRLHGYLRGRAGGSRSSTAPNSSPPMRRCAAIPRWTTWTSAPSRISACSPSHLRRNRQARPGAEAHLHQSGHRPPDDRDRPQGPASCWAWSASTASTTPACSFPGPSLRAPRQTPRVRLLRQVVPFARVFRAQSREAGRPKAAARS